MILALMNSSHGVGQTTLATHLADDLAGDGVVVLIDADPHTDASRWAHRRLKSGYPNRFRIVTPPAMGVREDIRALSRIATHVVIDVPSRISPFTQLALLMADLILVPLLPTSGSVAENLAMARMIADARRCREGLRAALVINRSMEGMFIAQSDRRALCNESLPLLACEVRQRRAFAQSAATGLLVREVAPSSSSAAEIAFLSQEVRRLAP